MPTIIGISGVTGAGKTTLAKSLAKDLKATLLCWDDFDDISIAPRDYVEWYKQGEDYRAWDYAALATALASLKNKQSILHPTLKQNLPASDFIIFDAPLGRLHQQTGKYIDKCIHLHVPLDVSLCRRLIRDFKQNDKSKDEIISELEYYLSNSRPLFFDDKLKASADLIIDGMLNISDQCKLIKNFVKK